MEKRRLSIDEYVLPGIAYRSVAGDVAGAATVLVGGSVLIAANIVPLPSGTSVAGLWAITILGAMLSFIKRRVPLVAVVLAIALCVAATVIAGGNLPLISLVVLFDTIYAAAITSRRTRPLIALAALFVVAEAVTLLILAGGIARENYGTFLWALLGLAAMSGLPLLWGMSVLQRDELLEAERQRSDAIALAAEARREAAVRAERGEVAAQLHDEIAARLAAISLQAGALGTIPDENPQRQKAIASMRASSHEALDELHRLIGVLASDRADDDAGVAADPVGALRAQADAFGADLVISGDPGDLSGPVAQGLARIANEAIANAARHAPGTAVRAEFARTADDVELTIRNALPPSPAGARGSGLGRELMAERWRTLGGSGDIGPDGDEWRVRVTLPVVSRVES